MRPWLTLVPASGLFTWLVTGELLLALGAVLATGAAWMAIQTTQVRRKLRRVHVARERFDPAALHAAVTDVLRLEHLRADVRQELVLQRALAHMMEEDFTRALEVLRTVELHLADPRTRLAVQADVAVCLAYLGETQEAIAGAEACAERARTHFPEIASVHEGILGVVYQCAGRHGEAIERIEASLETGVGNAGVEAILAFHLGEARAALGSSAEAVEAWRRSQHVAPHTSHGRRAAERLRQSAPASGATDADPEDVRRR